MFQFCMGIISLGFAILALAGIGLALMHVFEIGYDKYFELRRKYLSRSIELPVTMKDINVKALKQLLKKFVDDYQDYPCTFSSYKDGIEALHLVIDNLEK